MVTDALSGVQAEAKRRKLSTLTMFVNTLQIRKLLAVQSFEAVPLRSKKHYFSIKQLKILGLKRGFIVLSPNQITH